MKNSPRYCRSCGAPLIWIRTARGRLMPCKPGPRYYHPSSAGETFINRAGSVEKGVRCASTEEGARVGWKPHWIDCPHAKKHRRHRK